MFGITTPLTLKYLPQILKLAGEQMTIEMPPTAVQSLAEYASTIGQVGILIAVLVAMGSIANERRQGTKADIRYSIQCSDLKWNCDKKVCFFFLTLPLQLMYIRAYVHLNQIRAFQNQMVSINEGGVSNFRW